VRRQLGLWLSKSLLHRRENGKRGNVMAVTPTTSAKKARPVVPMLLAHQRHASAEVRLLVLLHLKWLLLLLCPVAPTTNYSPRWPRSGEASALGEQLQEEQM
jgi:hypothetical protein